MEMLFVFMTGIILGSLLGVGVMCLCFVAKQEEQRNEESNNH